MIDEMVWQAQYDAADTTAETAGLPGCKSRFLRAADRGKGTSFQVQIFRQVRAKHSKAYRVVSRERFTKQMAGKML